MIGAMTLLRLCFIVLFGAMSVMHGPVMTFSFAHVTTAAGHEAATHAPAGHSSEALLSEALPDCHEHQALPAQHEPKHAPRHVHCNAFACFMAVEPLPVVARPAQPVLFAIMTAAPVHALDSVRTAPALPPPRAQG